jgi:hypothetical protein
MTIQLTFDLVDLIIFLIIAFIAGTAASSLLVRYRYRSALGSTYLVLLTWNWGVVSSGER